MSANIVLTKANGGGTFTLDADLITAIAAMTSAQATAAGVTGGVRITTTTSAFDVSESFGEVLSRVAAAKGTGDKLVKIGAATSTEAGALNPAAPLADTLVTVPADGDYLIQALGMCGNGTAATGGFQAQLTVDAAGVGLVADMGAGAFVVNDKPEHAIGLSWAASLTQGQVVGLAIGKTGVGDAKAYRAGIALVPAGTITVA